MCYIKSILLFVRKIVCFSWTYKRKVIYARRSIFYGLTSLYMSDLCQVMVAHSLCSQCCLVGRLLGSHLFRDRDAAMPPSTGLGGELSGQT